MGAVRHLDPLWLAWPSPHGPFSSFTQLAISRRPDIVLVLLKFFSCHCHFSKLNSCWISSIPAMTWTSYFTLLEQLDRVALVNYKYSWKWTFNTTDPLAVQTLHKSVTSVHQHTLPEAWAVFLANECLHLIFVAIHSFGLCLRIIE